MGNKAKEKEIRKSRSKTMSEIIVKNTTDEPDYIILRYKPTGEEYKLQFSRATAVFAQQRGFNPNDFEAKMTIVVPDLFFYAMRKNHMSLSREKVDKLRETLFPKGLPSKVLSRLIELYETACTAQVIDLDSVDNEDYGKNADTEVEM